MFCDSVVNGNVVDSNCDKLVERVGVANVVAVVDDDNDDDA